MCADRPWMPTFLGRSTQAVLTYDDVPVAACRRRFRHATSHGRPVELSLKDVEVDRASSGPDALELLSKSCTYDAVITDIKMPIMDGLTLMAKICERRPNLPTLLLTGHGDRDIGVKALKSGAYAYMPKPVDRDYFLAWVQRAIHLSQLNRQIQEQIALERQRSQELAQVVLALRDSEGRFRLLVEVSFEAVAVSDHGRIIEVNSNFSTMFGYDDQTRLAAYYLHTAEGLPPVRTTAP